MKTATIWFFACVLAGTVGYMLAEAADHMTTCEGEKFSLRRMLGDEVSNAQG